MQQLIIRHHKANAGFYPYCLCQADFTAACSRNPFASWQEAQWIVILDYS